MRLALSEAGIGPCQVCVSFIRRCVTEAGCCWAGCLVTRHPCSQASSSSAQPGYLCPRLGPLPALSECDAHCSLHPSWT